MEVGKTEVIKDSLNPKFIKNFQVEYRFEERQKFLIKIYDVDDFNRPDLLDKHDFIGELEFMLHEVVTARNQILRKNLVNNADKARYNGVVILTAEENHGNKNNEMIDFEMRTTLNSSAAASAHDSLFFIIQRFVQPQQYVPVYKSEDKAQDPQVRAHKWDRVKILTSLICKEEGDREIQVDFYRF